MHLLPQKRGYLRSGFSYLAAFRQPTKKRHTRSHAWGRKVAMSDERARLHLKTGHGRPGLALSTS